MSTIKETMHEKRKATEDHIKLLQQEGERASAILP